MMRKSRLHFWTFKNKDKKSYNHELDLVSPSLREGHNAAHVDVMARGELVD